ncbi:MAG: uracil phosphoribosyltransferase [Bacilli bacterium]|nr:uracil phosphoribosyltransferase [Bacilli bacterium]
MGNVKELNHPLITHKLAILRDKNTGTKEFRELIGELAMLLCFEALSDVKLEDVEIETPIEKYKTGKFDESKYAFIPILRAGLGMLDGVLSVVPNAKVGHIGMYRDEETFKPVNYFFKVPKDIENKTVILLDPMLATGGSCNDAIDLLKEKGVKNIKFLCIIAAPEGIEEVNKKNSDIPIYCAHIDNHLNKNKYICPGLGDAGDRIFGTK